MQNILRTLRYDWPLHFVLFFTNWLPDNVIFLRLRGFLAKSFFKACGKDLRLGRNLTFYNPSNITIGNNVYIAEGNWFSAGTNIEIRNQVIFGPKSVITSSNHTRIDFAFRYGTPIRKPIVFKSGCWIAANCTITAGTTIGEGTLIAASTVTKGNIPNNLIFGSPKGVVIKQL